MMPLFPELKAVKHYRLTLLYTECLSTRYALRQSYNY